MGQEKGGYLKENKVIGHLVLLFVLQQGPKHLAH